MNCAIQEFLTASSFKLIDRKKSTGSRDWLHHVTKLDRNIITHGTYKTFSHLSCPMITSRVVVFPSELKNNNHNDSNNIYIDTQTTVTVE